MQGPCKFPARAAEKVGDAALTMDDGYFYSATPTAVEQIEKKPHPR